MLISVVGKFKNCLPLVNQSEIKTCKGCGARIYFSGTKFTPMDVATNDPHQCIVDSSVFRKTSDSFASRKYSGEKSPRLVERAISNELDRIASKAVVSDARLENRVASLEKKVKELELELLDKHNEIMVLKGQVKKLLDQVNELRLKN